MKVCLVVLIGLPGVGKSTLTNRLCDVLSTDQTAAVNISFDALFPLQSDQIEMGAFKSAREDYVAFAEACVASLKSSLPFPSTLVNFTTPCNFVPDQIKSLHNVCYLFIDDNNYYRSMRYRFFQIAKKYETGFAQIFLESDVSDAVLRDQQRCAPVGKEVVERMALKLERPSSVNKWEERTLIVGTNCVDETTIINFLSESLENPLRPVGDVKQENVTQSELHQLDVGLRKLISSVVASTPSHEKSETAQSMNERRKQILEDVKKGVVEVNLNTGELQQLMNISPNIL